MIFSWAQDERIANSRNIAIKSAFSFSIVNSYSLTIIYSLLERKPP